MSKMRIDVRLEAYGVQIPRTVVYVEGRRIYQSGNAATVEREHLESVIRELHLEDTVEVKGPCRACLGYGFVVRTRYLDDGYGEVDACPVCEPPKKL